ncbi:uncharacterized protein LOC127010867 [Drosophila biarmipes]|uniref:uncharacterized protein LOC127010867 n=1 Tax=Drosophila biarmipes TaxID=125945 RepID=UPI0021CC52DC|nr:uncharacterized protein LOC127010867 [Drosophila biarmipes]
MIPISSAKLNSKLAAISQQSKGGSRRRGCISLLAGMVLGVCLAGIIFYPSFPSEDYRDNSQNIIKIIGLEVPIENVPSNFINITKDLGVVNVSPTTSGIHSTHKIADEINKNMDN